MSPRASDWNSHEVRKFMESDLCLNLALCVLWGSSYFFFFPWSENTVLNQDLLHPFKNSAQIPCDRSSASPNTALCGAQEKRNEECYSPNTSRDEHDVYLISCFNSAGFSALKEQMDLASPSIWQPHMQFTSHMGSLSGNRQTIKCHQKLL